MKMYAASVVLTARFLAACSNTSGSIATDSSPFDSSTESSMDDTLLTETSQTDSPLTDINDVALVDSNSDSKTDVMTDGSSTTQNEGSAFVWQGFRHEWLRNIAGFRVPHRISGFKSHLSDESFVWTSPPKGSAIFTMGQSTGVDGNYMKPVGYFSAVTQPGITVVRREIAFQFTDDGDGSAYPKAATTMKKPLQVSVPISQSGKPIEHHAVFLSGIALDSKCDPAKQPVDAPCNSNGMWPYRISISVSGCNRTETLLTCDVSIEIARAWTPNKGGLPPFEEKPFNDKLDVDLKVFVTTIMGTSDQLHVTEGTSLQSTGTLRDDNVAAKSSLIKGQSGALYGGAALGIKSFSFEFYKTETADKFNHLGRYIGLWQLWAKAKTYDASTGSLSFEYQNNVWVPDTVEQSGVRYAMTPVLIQFAAVNGVATQKSVTGSICNNSNNAPFFSVWTQCGSADTGPLQAETKVSIEVP